MAAGTWRPDYLGAPYTALLLISTVPTSIVTLGISSDWQPVIEGAILAVALGVDAVRKR